MAGSIKLFQFFQKFQQTMGICPSQPNQNEYFITARKMCVFFCNTQITLTMIAFLVFETVSMFEFGFTFFLTNGMINSIVVYIISAWQVENTLKFIESCEGFIAKSKRNAEDFYIRTCHIALR